MSQQYQDRPKPIYVGAGKQVSDYRINFKVFLDEIPAEHWKTTQDGRRYLSLSIVKRQRPSENGMTHAVDINQWVPQQQQQQGYQQPQQQAPAPPPPAPVQQQQAPPPQPQQQGWQGNQLANNSWGPHNPPQQPAPQQPPADGGFDPDEEIPF